MHIGAPEMQSFTRVATALSLIGNVNGQISGVLQASQPDAAGSVHVKDDVADISLQIDPKTQAPKSFDSTVLRDVTTPDGTLVAPSGAKTHYEVGADNRALFRSEVPSQGNRVVTTLMIGPDGSMALDGLPITPQERSTYQVVAAAQALSALVGQQISSAAEFAQTEANQAKIPGAVKLADDTRTLDLKTDPASGAPLTFSANYLKESAPELGIPAGTQLSYNLSPQGVQLIHSEAPAPNGQKVGQDLNVNPDGSFDFNQYLIAK